MTQYLSNGVNGGVIVTKFSGETIYISEYLDFGFYDKVWFKDNASLSPSEPVRWLVILNCTGRLICYHILTHIGKVISRSTVQLVTNNELSTDEVKYNFVKFDNVIYQRLKVDNRQYK